MPLVQEALSQLEWLGSHIRAAFADVAISFDLADLRGYAYYSGVRFSIYSSAANDALARGGRYDEVGSVFGRKRPAVGFSLDVKALAASAQPGALRAAIRAPWAEDARLQLAIAGLRREGEIVVCVLPGHESEVDEFDCDRELRLVAGEWVVIAI
jgi:ATP phosphoribosyltransferase regulatory subunit